MASRPIAIRTAPITESGEGGTSVTDSSGLFSVLGLVALQVSDTARFDQCSARKSVAGLMALQPNRADKI